MSGHMLLQASALGINYEAMLLDDSQRNLFSEGTLGEPIAVVVL